MILDDFRFMWCGKELEPLTPEQAILLNPINIRGKQKKRAILLIHGFSSSPAVFREIIPSLSMYDAVVAPALPGHADSINAFGAAKAIQWLSAVEKEYCSLSEEYEAVDVMGLSLGGLLATHLSKRYPINHLYLLAPAYHLTINITASLNLAYVLTFLGIKSIRNRAGNMRSKQFKEITYRRLPITTIIEILTLINTFQFELPTCPTDVFLGKYDAVVDSKAVAKCFVKLPNEQIHWLMNTAHVLPLDGDIDTIINCVKSNWAKSLELQAANTKNSTNSTIHLSKTPS